MNLVDRKREYLIGATDDAIRQLSSEILRLIRLPYKSWKNQEKIMALDKQIEYLESLLAAYEKDKKSQ